MHKLILRGGITASWLVLIVAGAAHGQTSFKTLYDFEGPDRYLPSAGLVQGLDGNLYGTTESGGDIFYGTVFKMSWPRKARHQGECVRHREQARGKKAAASCRTQKLPRSKLSQDGFGEAVAFQKGVLKEDYRLE
jgi:hypothetical protein